MHLNRWNLHTAASKVSSRFAAHKGKFIGNTVQSKNKHKIKASGNFRLNGTLPKNNITSPNRQWFNRNWTDWEKLNEQHLIVEVNSIFPRTLCKNNGNDKI